MTASTSIAPAVDRAGGGRTLGAGPGSIESPGMVASYIELTKPRITRLVTITSGVGFVMAALGRPGWPLGELAWIASGALVGTVMSAAGASALNQWWEWRRDAMMPRTAHRPLPQGRVSKAGALGLGLVLCVLGVAVLWAMCGAVPAVVSLATILSYVLLYTPLKPITSLATLIGAVPGALPPLIGWTAASTHGGWILGDLAANAGGWSLFVLMLVWQVPHFLAIAWMYRDDYAKGGYRMLPMADADGRATASVILLWSVTLLPATLAPALLMPERLGAGYVAAAVLTGLGFIAVAVRLRRTRTREDARRVFFGSIIHLPVILAAMVADAIFRTF
ncbi:MAG: heme o synthase [Phycisphaeraceae bacterium]|nr:heme o synthase [Phycisphaeraceae bacterium]